MRLFDVLPNFLPPQVRRSAIITDKHGIYELFPKLPTDWRLRILGNQELSGKCLNFIEWKPNALPSSQNESFVNTNKEFLKTSNETFSIVGYFAWNLELVSDILWLIVSENFFFDCNSHKTSWNVIF